MFRTRFPNISHWLSSLQFSQSHFPKSFNNPSSFRKKTRIYIRIISNKKGFFLRKGRGGDCNLNKKRQLGKPRHRWENRIKLFLISNFCRVLNVVCFLLGNSPAPEFYMPTTTHLWRWNSVPKRRHIKFRRRKITQNKVYKIKLNITWIWWYTRLSEK
jgi:hypothetical protein